MFSSTSKRLSIVILVTSLFGCGKSETPAAKKVEHSERGNLGELGIKFRDSFDIHRQNQKARIAGSILANRPVTGDDLRNLLAVRHYAATDKKFDAWKILNATLPTFQKNYRQRLKNSNQSPKELKLRFEEQLAQSLKKEVPYNVEATSIIDIFRLPALQCYSGSMMFYYASPEDHDKEFVFIFTEGHVLPGFVSQAKGRWRLTGIESTVNGAGQVDFGFIDELDQPVRIVRARYVAVTEVFEGDITNLVDVGQRALKATADWLSLDLQHTEALVASVLRHPPKNAPLNASVFAFGVSNTPPGDRPRQTLDKIPAIQYRQNGGPTSSSLSDKSTPSAPISEIPTRTPKVAETSGVQTIWAAHDQLLAATSDAAAMWKVGPVTLTRSIAENLQMNENLLDSATDLAARAKSILEDLSAPIHAGPEADLLARYWKWRLAMERIYRIYDYVTEMRRMRRDMDIEKLHVVLFEAVIDVTEARYLQRMMVADGRERFLKASDPISGLIVVIENLEAENKNVKTTDGMVLDYKEILSVAFGVFEVVRTQNL